MEGRGATCRAKILLDSEGRMRVLLPLFHPTLSISTICGVQKKYSAPYVVYKKNTLFI